MWPSQVRASEIYRGKKNKTSQASSSQSFEKDIDDVTDISSKMEESWENIGDTYEECARKMNTFLRRSNIINDIFNAKIDAESGEQYKLDQFSESYEAVKKLKIEFKTYSRSIVSKMDENIKQHLDNVHVLRDLYKKRGYRFSDLVPSIRSRMEQSMMRQIMQQLQDLLKDTDDKLTISMQNFDLENKLENEIKEERAEKERAEKERAEEERRKRSTTQSSQGSSSRDMGEETSVLMESLNIKEDNVYESLRKKLRRKLKRATDDSTIGTIEKLLKLSDAEILENKESIDNL